MDEIKTVHYVSKDPIQNLKIKVTLTRLSVQRTKAQLTTQAVSVSYILLVACSICTKPGQCWTARFVHALLVATAGH